MQGFRPAVRLFTEPEAWKGKEMRRAITILFLGALLGAPLPPAVSAAPAAPAPTCFGERATIVGTDGEDTLEGTDDRDVIVGLGGIDEIVGRGGNDLICGGDNPLLFYPEDDDEPRLEWVLGGSGDDRIDGGAGLDMVAGGAGADVLLGGPGQDQVQGGPGGDRSFGQDGDDYFQEGVSERSSGSDDDLSIGGPGRDHITDHYGSDRVQGNSGRDYLIGGGGDDRLTGGAGDDLLAAGEGDDRSSGGSGYDLANYTSDFGSGPERARAVRVNLARGVAVGYGTDALSDIEGALAGAASDTLIGDEGPNLFLVGVPYARESHDLVRGRGGSDTITFAGHHYTGSCCYPVHVDLSENYAMWLDPYRQTPSDVRVFGVENVVGSDDSDVLIGDNHDNRLSALGGVDLIAGRGGSDVILGSIGGSPEYPEWEDDTLRGDGGDDVLRGGVGDDDLQGGSGRDKNHGGDGYDRCESPDPERGALECEAP